MCQGIRGQEEVNQLSLLARVLCERKEAQSQVLRRQTWMHCICLRDIFSIKETLKLHSSSIVPLTSRVIIPKASDP